MAKFLVIPLAVATGAVVVRFQPSKFSFYRRVCATTLRPDSQNLSQKGTTVCALKPNADACSWIDNAGVERDDR